MRVLHIDSYFRTSPFYKNLFDCQRECGVALRAYVPVEKGHDFGGRAFDDYADVSQAYGGLDRFFFHVKHGKIASDALARYRAEKFDLLHAHSLFSNGYVAMRLSEAMGIPYIVAVRDTDVNIFFKRMPPLRALGRKILEKAQAVVFISPGYRDHALEKYLTKEQLDRVKAKSVVLPNGIDDMWLTRVAPPKTRRAGDPVRMLLVGRIIPRKNIPIAAEAARILREDGLDATLTVIGQAEDESIVRFIDAQKHCKRLDARPMAQLIDVYRDADIFVLPSVRETFGLVYAEAMSQGLPVLYSKGQGFDGQLPEGDAGYAVNCRDARDIADKARAILADYDAMSARCVALCKKFDWHDIARQYAALYEKVGKD